MLISGRPHIFDVDPVSFATSTNLVNGTISPQLSIGARGEDVYGNEYRFGKVGASTLVTGNLLQGVVVNTDFIGMAVAAAAAAGQNQVTVTLGSTSTTAGLLDGAYAVVSVTPGIGQRFTIKSYTIATNGTSCVLTFFENITTALTTSSKIGVHLNPFNGLVASATTWTGPAVGACLAAGTTGTFTWVGSRGIYGVLGDANTAAIGDSLGVSGTTAGTVRKGVTLTNRIGICTVATESAKVQPELIML